jgi:hypothetical protein
LIKSMDGKHRHLQQLFPKLCSTESSLAASQSWTMLLRSFCAQPFWNFVVPQMVKCLLNSARLRTSACFHRSHLHAPGWRAEPGGAAQLVGCLLSVRVHFPAKCPYRARADAWQERE